MTNTMAALKPDDWLDRMWQAKVSRRTSRSRNSSRTPHRRADAHETGKQNTNSSRTKPQTTQQVQGATGTRPKISIEDIAQLIARADAAAARASSAAAAAAAPSSSPFFPADDDDDDPCGHSSHDPQDLPPHLLIPTSPRSVQACLRLGVDPERELAFLPLESFAERAGGKAAGGAEAAARLASLRFEHHERVRRERLAALVAERARVVAEGAGKEGGGAGGAAAAGMPARAGALGNGADDNSAAATAGAAGAKTTLFPTLMETERRKLDALRRRQAREIQQMVSHEAARREIGERQRAKAAAVEARQQAQQQEHQRREREWAAQQREREVQQAGEARARERAAAALAQARHAEEAAARARDGAAARRRARDLRAQEQEKRLAQDRCAQEQLLAQEAARREADGKRAEAAKRDDERAKRAADDAACHAAAAADRRALAGARIGAALDSGRAVLAQRREAFEAAARQSAQRRAEAAAAHARLAAERLAAAERAEVGRAAKQAAAAAADEIRRSAQRAEACRRDEQLRRATLKLAGDAAGRRVEHDLHDGDRRARVEALSRRQAYHRRLLLARIVAVDARVGGAQREKREVLEARRGANVAASMLRHRVAAVMAAVAGSSAIERIAPGGVVDAAALQRTLEGGALG